MRRTPPTAEPAHEPAVSADGRAWTGWRAFRVVAREFEDAQRSQCSFYLEPADHEALAAFIPGQYLTVSVEVPAAEGPDRLVRRTLTRCYSLSDRPVPARYRITIKRMRAPPGQSNWPDGAVSNHFIDHVHEGDLIQMKAPAGSFVLGSEVTVPIVLIAGGIGITPMMSMLLWCVSEQPQRVVHLFYGVRSGADHAFKRALEALVGSHAALQLHVVYEKPGLDDVQGRDYQHQGLVDLELLRRCLVAGRHVFYVCGPPPMIRSLVPALREWGVDSQDVHTETFGPASLTPGAPLEDLTPSLAGRSYAIRLVRAGRSLVWDGKDANLLDFVERHGVAVDAGCRSGNCGTCETRLVSGMVGYAATPEGEIAAGHCLLCVGHPLTVLELDL